jgi:putative endonuclease
LADEPEGSSAFYKMAYFCYILECSDGTFYTGWSTDPVRRERQHNAGRGARYTRDRRPVRLVYIEEQPDKPSALRRERRIKSFPRAKKKKLITEAGEQPAALS